MLILNLTFYIFVNIFFDYVPKETSFSTHCNAIKKLRLLTRVYCLLWYHQQKRNAIKKLRLSMGGGRRDAEKENKTVISQPLSLNYTNVCHHLIVKRF